MYPWAQHTFKEFSPSDGVSVLAFFKRTMASEGSSVLHAAGLT